MVTIKERVNNLKNVKKNWNIIQNNPYAHQRFMYLAYRSVVILIAIIIIFQIGMMIINTKTGSNPSMSLLTRAFMVLVGVLIILKINTMLNQLKTNLKHFEMNPANTQIDDTKSINLNIEIDNLLNKYSTTKK